jgi:type VI secretion system Hcp family effector
MKGVYQMGKISWKKAALPVLGVGLLSAGVISFAAPDQSSAHNRGNWDGDAKYYLKIDGVDGGVTDTKHKGAIELNAYRFMEDEPDVQATAEQKTALSDLGDNNLRVIADSSKASPALFEAAAEGKTLANATLTVQKPGKSHDYMTIKMTDLMVSNYQNSGNDDNESVDEVVFDYASVTVEHNEGTPFKKGWDFKNKKEVQ